MEIIKIQDIEKTFGTKTSTEHVLKKLSLSINSGEMIAIMGPSGSGKSTLMNIIGLMDTPSSGKYILCGEDTLNKKDKELSKIRNEKIGFVFQHFNLISNYSLVENIIIPMSYSKNKKDMKKRAIDELTKVGLSEHINKKVADLSGGQKQRVAIARALANNPQIILADEPTGALDEKTGLEILSLLKKLNNEGKTVVIVTHDLNIAKKCDKIIKIKDGQIII
ncbi:MAG: ABC transporter ATP-binding protein [Sarcina sp.]